jgi:hypothetical protein
MEINILELKLKRVKISIIGLELGLEELRLEE